MKEPLPKSCTVAVIIGFMLIVIYWCFVHAPLAEEYHAARAKAFTLKQDYAKFNRYLSRHPDLAAYKREADGAKLLADELVPDALNESGFLAYLSEETTKRQMEVLSVQAEQAITDGTGLTALPVHIRLRTDYWQLTDFLAALEKSTRFIGVQSMKITSSDERLECYLILTIYARHGEVITTTDREIRK